jgi:hypothetical protein
MFAERLQYGDQDGVVVDDNEHAEGVWSLPEAITVAFPPSVLLPW